MCVLCCVVLCVVCCVLCVCCVVCGVVCGAAWHAEKTSVYRFKTSPSVPAPRAHVLPYAGVVTVHTGTFLNLHTEVFGTDTRRRGGEGRERRRGSPSVLLTMRRPT